MQANRLHAPTDRASRRSADVRRQVLAGQRGPRRDEIGRGAFEDDAAAVVAGAGAQVDDPVGVRLHGLVVLDDDDRLAGVDQPVQQASSCRGLASDIPPGASHMER